MEKFIFEGKVDTEFEDGGSAMKAVVSGEQNIFNGSEVFVIIQSWDEKGIRAKTENQSHSLIKSIEGKKVRITIEVID